MRFLKSTLIVSLVILSGCSSQDRGHRSIFTKNVFQRSKTCCATNRCCVRKGGIFQDKFATRSQAISIPGQCDCASGDIIVEDPQHRLRGVVSKDNQIHSQEQYLPYTHPAAPLVIEPKSAPLITGSRKKTLDEINLGPPELLVKTEDRGNPPTTPPAATKHNQIQPLIAIPVVNPNEFKETSILIPHSQSVEVETQNEGPPVTKLADAINSTESLTELESLTEPETAQLEASEANSFNEAPVAPFQLQAIPASTSRILTEPPSTEPVLLDEVTPTPHAIRQPTPNEIPPETPQESLEPIEPVSIELPAEADPKRTDLIVLKATATQPLVTKKTPAAAVPPPKQQPDRVAKRIDFSERIDSFGLPTGPTVDFTELPPVGPHPYRDFHLPRPELDNEKVNGLPNIDLSGASLKSTSNHLQSQLELPDLVPHADFHSTPIQIGAEAQDLSVDPQADAEMGEPILRVLDPQAPAEWAEPMLRMKAIPAKQKSDDLPAVAKFNFDDQIFVTDLKRLDHNDLQQATRKAVKSKNQVKILDR